MTSENSGIGFFESSHKRLIIVLQASIICYENAKLSRISEIHERIIRNTQNKTHRSQSS